MDLGVTSGAASRRSASTNKQRQKWVQKKTHDDTYPDGRHLGEFSKGSRRSLTPPKEESNFDRSPQVEEAFFPNQEPEIQWRRRSEIPIPEEEEKEDMKEEEEKYLKDEYYMEDEQEELNDTINMEVVYMEYQHEAGSIAGGGDCSPKEQEMEVEENPFDDENATLADIRRQMWAKDREISQLNEKMTEMMAQMTAMMQMMQRTAAAGTMPNPPTDPPNLRMPQVSGVRGTLEGGHEKGINSSVPLVDERRNDKKLVQEEQWETAVSKKTAKMLKHLEGVPIVEWKSPIEPVLNLKGLPKVQASTSKQHLSQASSSKPGKPKFFKKKTKMKKPKEKKTVTQKVIDSLDEYYQTVRQPIKLADFMSGLKIGEIEEDGDANPLPTEVCRVVSVVPSMPVNEEYVKREAPEACMMVLPMDCSSEEDLYFPEEDESDPDIASQMEHVNLGGDSEFADESPDATMADSEENVLSNESEPEVIAQVQLRSGKILPPPPKKGVSDKDKGKDIASDVVIRIPGQCRYPDSPTVFLGLASAIAVVIAQATISIIAGCICCRRNANISDTNWTVALISFVASWITFIIAFLLLLTGVAVNDLKSVDQSNFDDYCYIVKPGVFSGGAIFSLASVSLGIVYYLALQPSKPSQPLCLPQNEGISFGKPHIPPQSTQPAFVHEDTYKRQQIP
ncbi:hypothetical protein M5K25_022397 [Dendrobium thyrsiflorum]|uniref:Uncharacterized protein n=1 Tax=Dendrobium thyrsiflorum TaxID=117978 RepID=A0ABD0U6K9_DENTH